MLPRTNARLGRIHGTTTDGGELEMSEERTEAAVGDEGKL